MYYLCGIKPDTTFQRAMRNHFIDFLGSINRSYTIPNVPTNLEFQYQGLNLLFQYSDSDPMYFRILVPNILQTDDSNTEESNQVMAICNDLTQKFKVAKTYISDVNRQVWISIEVLVGNYDNIFAVYQRSIDILEEAYREFAQTYTSRHGQA